jgi:hypothetical protein
MTLTCSCLACSRHQAQQGNCTACSRCCPITNCWASRWSRCAGGEAAFFYCLNACPPACMHVKCGAGACASALLQVLHVSVTER